MEELCDAEAAVSKHQQLLGGSAGSVELVSQPTERVEGGLPFLARLYAFGQYRFFGKGWTPSQRQRPTVAFRGSRQ